MIYHVIDLDNVLCNTPESINGEHIPVWSVVYSIMSSFDYPERWDVRFITRTQDREMLQGIWDRLNGLFVKGHGRISLQNDDDLVALVNGYAAEQLTYLVSADQDLLNAVNGNIAKVKVTK